LFYSNISNSIRVIGQWIRNAFKLLLCVFIYDLGAGQILTTELGQSFIFKLFLDGYTILEHQKMLFDIKLKSCHVQIICTHCQTIGSKADLTNDVLGVA